MNEILENIVRKIDSLPEPGDVMEAIKKINETNSSLNTDEMVEKLKKDYLRSQPNNLGIIKENVAVKSIHPCEICNQMITNGGFNILFIKFSNTDSIEQTNIINISFDAFHKMKIHGEYNNKISAINGETSIPYTLVELESQLLNQT